MTHLKITYVHFNFLGPLKWLAMGWTIGFRGRRENFVFATIPRLAHRPTQPSVQKRWADHWPQSVAEATSDVTTVFVRILDV